MSITITYRNFKGPVVIIIRIIIRNKCSMVARFFRKHCRDGFKPKRDEKVQFSWGRAPARHISVQPHSGPFKLEVFSCCCFSWDWGCSFLSPVGGRSRRRGEVKLSRISSSLVRVLWGASLLRSHTTEEKGTEKRYTVCFVKTQRKAGKWRQNKVEKNSYAWCWKMLLCKTLSKSGFVFSCTHKALKQ